MQRAVVEPMQMARDRDEKLIKRYRETALWAVFGAICGRLSIEVLILISRVLS